MPRKDLHIVFGHTAKATLLQSGYIEEESAEIIRFDDPLASGPLFELDDIVAVANRKEWLKLNCGHDDQHFVDKNILRMQSMLAHISDFTQIYLWLGPDSNERVLTTLLLYHLKAVQITIWKPNFNRAKFIGRDGQRIYPHSLNQMSSSQIAELGRTLQVLEYSDIKAEATIWQRLSSDRSAFRIFEEKDSYILVGEDYFDQLIFARCTGDYQSAPRIVGNVLYDTWDKHTAFTDDSFLFQRLNMLAQDGKLEITDRDKDSPEDRHRSQRIFKVRLAP